MPGVTVGITGATGFIGSHLIALMRQHYASLRLRILTRDRPRAQALLGNGLEFVEGDVCDPETIAKTLAGVECIFHLAAETRFEQRMRTVNLEGTLNLVRSCRNSRIRKLIYLSSAGVSGQNKIFSIDEETPCVPDNEYEHTKLEAENVVKEYGVSEGVSTLILRPTIVFGDGKADANDSFYQLMRQIGRKKYFLLNSGKGAANYVYVGDVAKALLSLYQDNRRGCFTYIVNDQTDMGSIFSYACEAMGIAYKPWDLPYEPVRISAAIFSSIIPGFTLTPSRVRALNSQFSYSAERIRRELNFTFDYGIKQGIIRTVSWLKEKGWL